MKRDDLKELGVVTLASPCRARWNDMVGDEQVRLCGACDKHVYNLSALSTLDARELLRRTEGKVCVRFFARADGTVLTRDCAEGLRLRRHRFIASLAAAVSLVVGVLALPFPIAMPLDRALVAVLDTLGLAPHFEEYTGTMLAGPDAKPPALSAQPRR
jgi:hypothetical protein